MSFDAKQKRNVCDINVLVPEFKEHCLTQSHILMEKEKVYMRYKQLLREDRMWKNTGVKWLTENYLSPIKKIEERYNYVMERLENEKESREVVARKLDKMGCGDLAAKLYEDE